MLPMQDETIMAIALLCFFVLIFFGIIGLVGYALYLDYLTDKEDNNETP